MRAAVSFKTFFWCALPLVCVSACVQPAAPENGHVSTTSRTPHPTGARAKYNCDIGFIHIGVEERVCRGNGQWTDRAPVCAVNVALYMPASQSSTAVGVDRLPLHANLSTDGTIDGGCATTATSNDDAAWWTVDLLENHRIYAVEIVFAPAASGREAVRINSLVIKAARYDKGGTLVSVSVCAVHSGFIENGRLQTFVCDEEVVGRQVTIETDDGVLQLCEVFVLSVRAVSSWQCGAYSSMELFGVHTHHCFAGSSNEKANWLTAQERCLEMGATLPVKISAEQRAFLGSQLSHRARGPDSFYWIGAESTNSDSQRRTSGGQLEWQWVDGSPVTRKEQDWVDPNVRAVPLTSQVDDDASKLAVVMSRPFSWRWMPSTQSVWNSWICQSKPRFCSSAAIPEAGGLMLSSQTLAVGTVAYYFCTNGYRLVGTTKRECLSSGLWSLDVPRCQALECKPIDNPTNGRIRYLNESKITFGSIIQYRCQKGYKLSMKQSLRFCQNDGTWSGVKPSCNLVDCGTPPSIGNGTMTYAETMYASTVKYSCLVGFRIVDVGGVRQAVCGADGRWTPLPPPRCHDLDHPANLVTERDANIFTPTTAINDTVSNVPSTNAMIIAILVLLLILICLLLIAVWFIRNKQLKPAVSLRYGLQHWGEWLNRVAATSDGSCSSASPIDAASAITYGHCQKENLYYASTNATQQTTIAELEVPPELLHVSQLPNGNLRIAMPEKVYEAANTSRLPVPQQPPLPPLPLRSPPPRPPLPTLLKRTNSVSLSKPTPRQRPPFKRPNKFKTLVGTVRSRMSTSTAAESELQEQPENTTASRRRLSAADIVFVGTVSTTTDSEYHINSKVIDLPIQTPPSVSPCAHENLAFESKSPTPSELYSFERDDDEWSDGESCSDRGDDGQPIYDFPPLCDSRGDERYVERSSESPSKDSGHVGSENIYEELKIAVSKRLTSHAPNNIC